MSTPSGNTGPLGHPRGIGFAILMTIITIGFYSLYWVFNSLRGQSPTCPGTCDQ